MYGTRKNKVLQKLSLGQPVSAKLYSCASRPICINSPYLLDFQSMSEIKNNVVPSQNKNLIETMFKAGAHFAFSRARRHPSAKSFIFGVKNKVEIFDLEKTADMLEKAKAFVRTLGAEDKQLLFISGKSEARDIIQKAAESINMPYVAGRWIGGTFTNYSEIKRRIEKMESQMSKREKGELTHYTKKERLMIDREIDNLLKFFGGLATMKDMPKAIFVVDAKRENIAVAEANKTNIPVIALSSSDGDFTQLKYGIPANDGAMASISFFVNEIVEAYKEGKKMAPKKVAPSSTSPVSSTPVASVVTA